MKNIEYGRFTRIEAIDEPGSGGAYHSYMITGVEDGSAMGEYGEIKFQNGPVGENDINGCYIEDLLHIVVHRLQSFQSGEYACRENAISLTKIQEALHWLNHRTCDRQKRNVEGKSIK